jgi:uncharacterized protein YjiS (DUF1127 family)
MKHVLPKRLLIEWYRRARSRRDIAPLDERTIRDLGLTPGQMKFEAAKPFWRA